MNDFVNMPGMATVTSASSLPWFQFSLARCFIATALIAAGLGGLTWLSEGVFPAESIGVMLGLWYFSGGLIGAGLLVPFRKASWGAIAGFLVSWAYFATQLFMN